MRRSGLATDDDYLTSLSGQIRQLQTSPGRLLQTLEQSSADVWNNSLSGVNPAATTVSYYGKGQVVGFLLDAHVRRLTDGRKSFDDAMRLAYRRYAGAQGFTAGQFRSVVEETAGADLAEWFTKAIGLTEELDYSEALDWWGLAFGPGWKLEVRPDATSAQRAHLAAWLSGR